MDFSTAVRCRSYALALRVAVVLDVWGDRSWIACPPESGHGADEV